MTKFFNRKWKAGFTLVELIVVIAILAILAGIAVPVYNGYIKKANQAADNQLLAAVNSAFATACFENGNYDMKNLPFAPTASLSNGSVTMGTYNEDFQKYFAGNGTFKYFEVLGFNRTEGVFVGTTEAALIEAMAAIWGDSSFSSEDGSVEQELLGQFDSIADLFGTYGTALGNILSSLSESSPEIAKLFDGMGLTGLAATSNLTDEQVAAYLSTNLEGFDSMTAEEKQNAINEYRSIVSGNAAVLYVANDATGRTVADVQQGLGDLMNVFAAASSVDSLTDDDVLACYRQMLSGDELADFEAQLAEIPEADMAAAMAELRAGLNQPAFSMGDTTLTVGGMYAMQQAIQSSDNLENGGVSNLGALYALTTGYYNSEYFTGEKPSTTGGTAKLQAVLSAISDPSFQTYYTAQGATDIEAYLDAMAVLDAHSDSIDMTSENAFGDEYDFIAEVLGITP